MMEEKNHIYHEKQRLQFCLLHALNNLFQEKDTFTRAELNIVAEELSLVDPNKEKWSPLSVVFKPHHNSITGNYDINVLIAALEAKGKRVVWHDRRNSASSVDLNTSEDTLMGIVLNIPVTRFGGIWKSRHWVTLRRIEGIWYNLDSDFIAPQPFKDSEEVKEFLDSIIKGGVVSISCLLVVVISILRLPDVRWERGSGNFYRDFKIRKVFEEEKLGKLGELMVGLLPDDLAFTVFVPSENAFKRHIDLHVNESLAEHKMNDTYAILSRVLAFSTVPRKLPSFSVPYSKEISFDSLSGFILYVSRNPDGMLVVNRVQSERVDLKKGEIVVHIMNGVIMDAEFEQSVRPDYEEED